MHVRLARRAVPIELSAGASCPRYRRHASCAASPPTAQSPLWMRERLRRAGLRPISPLVDVDELRHARARPAAARLRRRQARQAVSTCGSRAQANRSRCSTADAIALDRRHAVIADARGPGRAGRHHGRRDRRRSAERPRDVFLESAHFAPAAIAGTSRELGMHTDASLRFERGVDPQRPRCARRARHPAGAADLRRARRTDQRAVAAPAAGAPPGRACVASALARAARHRGRRDTDVGHPARLGHERGAATRRLAR